MKTVEYTFWQDDKFFIGFLNDFPDYETQGLSKEKLLENLKSLLEDIETKDTPYIIKFEEMAIV